MPVGIAQSIYRPPERVGRRKRKLRNLGQIVARSLFVLASVITMLMIRNPDEVWYWTWRILPWIFLALAVVGEVFMIFAFCWAATLEPEENVAARIRLLEAAAERGGRRFTVLEKPGLGGPLKSTFGLSGKQKPQIPSQRDHPTRPAKCA